MEGIQQTTQTGSFAGQLSGQGVDRQAFLNLLVTQLKNQDPFEPVANEQFLAQLATFSQLEEAQSTNSLLSDLLRVNSADLALGGLAQAASLVGKVVEYIDPETGAQIRGTVYSVYFDPTGVLVEVDGNIVPAGSIVTISTDPNATSAGTPGDPNASGNGTAPSAPTPNNNPGVSEETGNEG